MRRHKAQSGGGTGESKEASELSIMEAGFAHVQVDVGSPKAHSTEELLRELRTDRTRGLTSIEAQQRLEEYGLNALTKSERMPLWKAFLIQFSNVIVLLLIAACIASFAMGEWVEGIAVLLIATLNAFIAVFTEKSANDALERLASIAQPFANVIRDGETVRISTEEVVPGDLLRLHGGDVVPADCRILSAADLKVNEMSLTGEPDDVKKYTFSGEGRPQTFSALTPPDEIFSSTLVTTGTGVAVVKETGMGTRVGRIAQLMAEASGEEKGKQSICSGGHRRKTPLQEKLHKLGLLISTAALTACVGVFTVGVVRGYSDPEFPNNPPAVQMIMVAVSLAVSAIPEGLPLCVTICLALGTSAMIKKNALARSLPAVETLGSVQVVCTDKTGTLTEGKMTVVRLWVSGQDISVSGGSASVQGSFTHTNNKEDIQGCTRSMVHSTLTAAAMNCTSELKLKGSDGEANKVTPRDLPALTTGTAQAIAEGNSTENALLFAAAKAGIYTCTTAVHYPYVNQSETDNMHTPDVPFNSQRKMMMTLIQVPQPQAYSSTDDLTIQAKSSTRSIETETGPTLNEGITFSGIPLPAGTRYIALVKGAPNYVLDSCGHSMHLAAPDADFESSIRRMDRKQARRVTNAIDDFSTQALRTLAVAIKPLSELPFDPMDHNVDAEEKFQALNKDLIFLGLVACMDPERPGVRESVLEARQASIKTIMITGDYLKTAVAIAKNISLLQPNEDSSDAAVDCTSLRPLGNEYLPDPDIDAIVSRTLVFARAQPEDKLQIVRSLRRQGMVCSMTGDGVNDAAALTEADVGVAMGVCGTEVAKGASDMILLDDDFCTIVTAIETGRRIYNNIQKFITYLLGTNVAQVCLILLAVAIGLPNPIQPLPILFLNLAIDGAPAMAMSVEPSPPDMMSRKPRPRKQPIITVPMLRSILAHAAVTVLCTLASLLLGLFFYARMVLLADLVEVYEDGGSCEEYDPTSQSFSVTTDANCALDAIKAARTMAFITLLLSELLRCLTVRSERAFYQAITSNPTLLKAATLSGTLATLAIFLPGVRDIFGFTLLRWHAYLTAVGLGLMPFFSDELVKAKVRMQGETTKRWDKAFDSFASLHLEMRHLRQHIIRLEQKLGTESARPPRRSAYTENSDVATPTPGARAPSFALGYAGRVSEMSVGEHVTPRLHALHAGKSQ